MELQIICVIALSLSVAAIRVPVDGTDEQPSRNVGEDVKDLGSQEPVFYTSNEAHIDSYLVPPDPHKQEEIFDLPNAGTLKPATHLVPPSQEKQHDYYANPLSYNKQHDQTDWLPITKGPEQPAPLPVNEESEGEKKSDYQFVNNPVVIPSELNTKQRGNIVFENPEPESPPNDEDLFAAKKRKYPMNPSTEPPKNKILGLPVPSRQLEPPSVGALDEYSLSSPLKYGSPPVNPPLRLTPAPPAPLAKIVFNPNLQKKVALNFDYSSKVPRIALDLTPPKLNNLQRVPTALYPKKFTPFHTVPIPVGPFVEIPDSLEVRPLGNFMTLGKKFVGRKHHSISKGKPTKPFQPYNSQSLPVPDENRIHIYQQQEEQRNPLLYNAKEESSVTETNERTPFTPEQETSETNFNHPGRNHHQASVKPIGKSGTYEAAATPPNERTEFRMHGMKGPHSYQFGFDTGKGKNRQFRYEERDNDGHVRGHYGYMDKHGKLRVVNYDADPKLGFRAEAPTDAEKE